MPRAARLLAHLAVAHFQLLDDLIAQVGGHHQVTRATRPGRR